MGHRAQGCGNKTLVVGYVAVQGGVYYKHRSITPLLPHLLPPASPFLARKPPTPTSSSYTYTYITKFITNDECGLQCVSHVLSQRKKIFSQSRTRELHKMNAEPVKEGAATPGWVRDLEKRRQQVNARTFGTSFCSYNTL